MIRRTLTAQQREHVAHTAAEKRVALGLEPVAAEDLEYEAHRAEAETARKRKRRVVAPRPTTTAPVDCALDIRERVGEFWVEVKLYWTHERTMGEQWVWSAFLFWEDDVRVRLTEAELGAHASQAEAFGQLLDALAAWCEHYPALAAG